MKPGSIVKWRGELYRVRVADYGPECLIEPIGGGSNWLAKTAELEHIDVTPPEGMRVEICRSFTYKHNAGNYESRDFFCSQKAECSLADAVEVSAALYA